MSYCNGSSPTSFSIVLNQSLFSLCLTAWSHISLQKRLLLLLSFFYYYYHFIIIIIIYYYYYYYYYYYHCYYYYYHYYSESIEAFCLEIINAKSKKHKNILANTSYRQLAGKKYNEFKIYLKLFIFLFLCKSKSEKEIFN